MFITQHQYMFKLTRIMCPRFSIHGPSSSLDTFLYSYGCAPGIFLFRQTYYHSVYVYVLGLDIYTYFDLYTNKLYNCNLLCFNLQCFMALMRAPPSTA